VTIGRPRTISDEQILTGAAQVIARVGPAGLTLAAVGAEVGLSAASLVQRFGSKRDLLLAVARRGADTMPRTLATAAEAAAPALALVDRFARLASGIHSRKEFANHLAVLLLDLADPEFQQISHAHAVGVERAIAEVLKASVAAGEMVPNDLDQLPRALHAAYNGALVSWGMLGVGRPAEHVRRQLSLLLRPHLTHPTRSRQRRTT
jgi:AcrR family transcriptional regulator